MIDKNVVIEKLLKIVSGYQGDGECKEFTIDIEVINYNQVKITKLITKGESHYDTPFYSGSMFTMIVEEVWEDNEVVDASILWQEK